MDDLEKVRDWLEGKDISKSGFDGEDPFAKDIGLDEIHELVKFVKETCPVTYIGISERKLFEFRNWLEFTVHTDPKDSRPWSRESNRYPGSRIFY